MLQVGRRILCCLAIAAASFAGRGDKAAATPDVEWLLENGLGETYLDLAKPDISSPEELQDAYEDYRKERFRLAALKLEKLERLGLPDGRTDFTVFMLAECYRMLKLGAWSLEKYRYIIDRFPSSDKCPPSYFRLLQDAYVERNSALADSVFDVFQVRYKMHPLFYSVVYTVAQLYYRTERYGEAQELLLHVPKTSSRHFQSQFLAAVCLIQLQRTEKALLVMEYLRKNASDERLLSEVNVVIGDVYTSQENYKAALPFYLAVPGSAPRGDYAVARTARLYLELEQLDKAAGIAVPFVERRRDSKFYFEMASILEQIYVKRGQKEKAAEINGLVYRRIVEARFRFEVQKELAGVYDMMGSWKRIRYDAAARADETTIGQAELNLEGLSRLERKCRGILRDLGILASDDPSEEIPGLSELRYARVLRGSMQALEDTIRGRKAEVEELTQRSIAAPDDTVLAALLADKDRLLDSAEALHARTAMVHRDLRRAGWYQDEETERLNNEMQAKFIDWAFMRYLDKKDQLEEMNREISDKTRKKADQDSLSRKGTAVAALFASMDRTELLKSIVESRASLVDHIATLLEASPSNRYVPQILFRQAELYFDEATDDFDKRLRVYEEAMAAGADSAGTRFPEYNLDKVIEIYDRIIEQYPREWVADDAYFYKAMALRKIGDEEKANEILLELAEKYPESEYFVEANMNIGRFFFERPTYKNNTGYKLAEEAYRRVLYYRDQPQFVQALYHLGWCYYMQDQYEEAIAVFKYLIEEVQLDFDASRMEEMQIVNPLMRAEAVDFIAISFDERGDLDDAMAFLGLIGNEDYAALVVKRIAELREEDLDYEKAIAVYRRLLEKYKNSSGAPDAAVSLIKIYESTNRPIEAMIEREQFFKSYARGTEWYARTAQRDSVRTGSIDSMAIAIGLYVADAQYRDAEAAGDQQKYTRAVENYLRLVESYPTHPKAIDARWNVAVILETKLGKPKKAYREYVEYSLTETAPEDRREQAALNAIAIVQRVMPTDTGIEMGKLEEEAVKMIQASENYVNLFPNGKAIGDVVLTMGSVYFNRKMYANASKVYGILTSRGPDASKYHEARFLEGQCLYGEENWLAASDAFKEVWKGASGAERKDEAYKLMLQSRFLNAKKLAEAKDHEKAALAFAAIEDEHPGSVYGDVALFNAAEAWEGLEQWEKACKSYYRLHQSYSGSKLAPDALFNAAADFEKAGKYDKAAEAYELLAGNYPDHDKAKDALFNVGFCYEKLGKLEKMAEANERYTLLYPGEADVEAMLLRSAQFYYKAEMYDKARRAYRNFVQRFPRSDRSVEALYLIGESYAKEGDKQNAVMNYSQAEQQNRRLKDAGLEVNSFHAGEAAYRLATVKREEFSATRLEGEPEQIKALQVRKTELLKEAAQSYQRVMQYQSVRMFEAGYRIGELYEDFATAWVAQKIVGDNPIKEALARKDQCMVSSNLLQKSFVPYKKVLELAAKIDSLGDEQRTWVDSTRSRVAQAYYTSGEYMADGIRAMQQAPVPKEIAAQPLYHFQYLKQILEALEPLKAQARDYFLTLYRELLDLKLEGEAARQCAEEFSRLNYVIPTDFDNLAQRILKTADVLPEGLSDEEREELVFQLEDMVFEVQDKALFSYEDALRLAQQQELTESPWYRKVLEALARLSPETYGKSFYETMVVVSDRDWIVRTDSVKNWSSAKVPRDGWSAASRVTAGRSVPFPVGRPRAIWGGAGFAQRVFAWKNLYLNGEPREVKLYLATCGQYRLYINGTLVTSDTVGSRSFDQTDSVAGAMGLFKGGDNVLAFHGEVTDTSCRGFAVAFEAMIDTTKRFGSSVKSPEVADAEIPPAGETPGDGPASTPDSGAIADPRVPAAPVGSADTAVAASKIDYAQEYKNRGELLTAIDDYKRRETETALLVKRERMEVQKIRLKIDGVDEVLAKARQDVETMKQMLDAMGREK